MWQYEAPLRDMRYVIEDVLGLPARWAALPAFAELNADTARQVLAEAARFATEVLAPTNASGDLEGCTLADGVVRRTGRRDAMLRVSLVAVLLSLPFMAGFVFVREIQLALVCAGVMNLLLSAAIPPIMNYAIGLVGPRERGITATVVIILMGLVGGALGPAVVGAISDGWQAEHGAQALRYGLAAMLVSPIIAGWIIASVLRTGDVRI